MQLPNYVEIREVGPRDGLQNEATIIDTAHKVDWLNLLSNSGLSYIEVSSFVSPKWMPQLADAMDVFMQIERKPTICYAALVPNEKGLQRALAAGVDEVNIFMSASEGHNMANINKSIEHTFPILQSVVEGAKEAGKSVRAYISTAFACPYDGPTKPEKVYEIASRLLSFGVDELSIGDTIGVAVPTDVDALLSLLLKDIPHERLAMHFHDTRGTALANIYRSMQFGIAKFDSATAGIGGCPYAKGASGNVATEDLLYMLDRMGIATNVSLQKIVQAALHVEHLIGRPSTSKLTSIAKGDL